MLQNSLTNDLAKVQSLIDNETFLRISVVDLQVYDDRLVVMTDHAVPRTFVRLLLKNIWDGPVEVFCASALMSGSELNLT